MWAPMVFTYIHGLIHLQYQMLWIAARGEGRLPGICFRRNAEITGLGNGDEEISEKEWISLQFTSHYSCCSYSSSSSRCWLSKLYSLALRQVWECWYQLPSYMHVSSIIFFCTNSIIHIANSLVGYVWLISSSNSLPCRYICTPLHDWQSWKAWNWVAF